ncbi:MAG: YsnF/AvaK domain-containing protein [Candidatus Dormibacteraeota bacterium]|uniref:YsnF/AvaK domain-containing protein n=1 Tax=Candidatus Amunia macphersoniae TaxID=3127014 RepID=A0A934KLG8_9BACT|nr:YsnF/AvaK domain-containing protein [Candidatus Dormibacteraeota bacterium]
MDHTQYEGTTVLDNQGNKVGKISEVYVDDQTQAPQWGLIHTGLFGTKQTFVPLVGATPEGDQLRVPYEKSQINDAPRMEADGELSIEDEEELARYYGLGVSTEQSSTGLVTGGRPVPTTGATGAESDASITRSEEQMRVGAMRRPSELVRLRKTVVTEPVSETIPLQREEVRVEREPITEGGAVPGAEISEQVHEVTLSREEPVVEKTTVPVERVRVEKDVTTEEREVTGEVRKEQIEVDREPQR